MLDGDGGPALRNSVERFDLVEPFALLDAFLQVEARRGGIAGGSAPMTRLDRHCAMLSCSREHNKNIIDGMTSVSEPCHARREGRPLVLGHGFEGRRVFMVEA